MKMIITIMIIALLSAVAYGEDLPGLKGKTGRDLLRHCSAAIKTEEAFAKAPINMSKDDWDQLLKDVPSRNSKEYKESLRCNKIIADQVKTTQFLCRDGGRGRYCYICLPPLGDIKENEAFYSVDYAALTRTVVKFLKDNPQRLDEGMGWLIGEAWQQAYPCK